MDVASGSRMATVRPSDTGWEADDLTNLKIIGVDTRINSLDSLGTSAKFGSDRGESVPCLNRVPAAARGCSRQIDDLSYLESIWFNTRVGCLDGFDGGMEPARDGTEGVSSLNSIVRHDCLNAWPKICWVLDLGL